MRLYPGKEASKLLRYSQAFWTQELREYDITSSEYPIFIILHYNDGFSQEEIAEDLGVDKSAITRTVQSMIAKNFISREKDEHDQRCYRLHLTEYGEKMYQPIEKGIDEWNSIVQQNITEDEFKEFKKTLKKILGNVEFYLKKK